MASVATLITETNPVDGSCAITATRASAGCVTARGAVQLPDCPNSAAPAAAVGRAAEQPGAAGALRGCSSSSSGGIAKLVGGGDTFSEMEQPLGGAGVGRGGGKLAAAAAGLSADVGVEYRQWLSRRNAVYANLFFTMITGVCDVCVCVARRESCRCHLWGSFCQMPPEPGLNRCKHGLPCLHRFGAKTLGGRSHP